MRKILMVGLVLLGVGFLLPAAGRTQCLLANPSFELAGSGGPVFAGWNQFGNIGSVGGAPHGAAAARVSGPNTGNWDVSGYWQPLDTAAGERWSASVCYWHSSANPLAGQSSAILNIEWRDAGDNLISYESHPVADAATPIDEVAIFTVDSGPAPAGAVSTRLLLGVLQGPTDPQPEVFYDQATFLRLGSPTHEENQWGDFPGGTTLNFSGRTWRVKGPGLYGPGPNLFSDAPTSTWVDGGDRLHLTIKNVGGSWYSTEVVLEDALGYGDYIFTTAGDLGALHENAVLGLFIWEYGDCYDPVYGWWGPYNEIDIEMSRWGNPANDLGQFVAQPYDFPGNIERFSVAFSPGEITSHAFRWLPDRVEYRSWRGGPEDELPGTMIHSWTYTGPHIPRPEQPRVHINLWQVTGPPAGDQEAVFNAFTFVPACIPPHCTEPVSAPPVEIIPRVTSAYPNPFHSNTTVRYSVLKAGAVEVAVFDVSGSLVRTLVRRSAPIGTYEIKWDGTDNAGRPAASGIYLYRYRSDDVVETKRMVMLTR